MGGLMIEIPYWYGEPWRLWYGLICNGLIHSLGELTTYCLRETWKMMSSWSNLEIVRSIVSKKMWLEVE